MANKNKNILAYRYIHGANYQQIMEVRSAYDLVANSVEQMATQLGVLSGATPAGLTAAGVATSAGAAAVATVLVAAILCGIKISIDYSLFKDDSKLQKSFMKTMDRLFAEFEAELSTYSGDNKTLINARNIWELQYTANSDFSTWFWSYVWRQIKTIYLDTTYSPAGILFNVAKWRLMMPTDQKWWTVMRAFALFIKNKEEFDIEADIVIDYTQAAALSGKLFDITNMAYNFPAVANSGSPVTMENWLSFLQTLIDTGSTFYIIQIKSGFGNTTQYETPSASNTTSNDAYYIYYPVDVGQQLDINVTTASTGYNYLAKPSEGVSNWQFELASDRAVSTLHQDMPAYQYGQSIWSSVPTALVALRYNSEKTQINSVCGGMKTFGQAEEYNSFSKGFYRTYSNQGDAQIIEVKTLLTVNGSGIYKGTSNYLNDQITEQQYIDDTVELITSTNVLDETGTITGDKTITITDEIYETLIEDANNVAEKQNASVIADGVSVSGVSGDTIDKVITNIQTNESGGEQNNPLIPSIPILSSAANAGLFRIFNPSKSQIKQLGSELWSTNVLDQIKQIWNDPMEGVISLSLFPVKPDANKVSNCVIGLYDTGIEMPVVSNQFKQINAGSITIMPYFFSALDYSPFTKISIFVPYVGFQELDVDEVMGGTLTLYYTIDYLSGAFVASLYLKNYNYNEVLYQWAGSMNMQIPITSASYSQLIQQIATIGSGVVTGAVSGGVAGAIASGVSGIASNILTDKTDVRTKGGIGGCAGALSNKIPYLIVQRPEPIDPQNFNDTNGYISRKGGVVGDFTGWTVFENVELNVQATQSELDMIQDLLKGGVYL